MMALAPPPAPGSRIHDLGDRLVVSFRPRRLQIGFLTFFFVVWTLIGLELLGSVVSAEHREVFEVVFLCLWTLGEGTAAMFLTWLVVGQETLTVGAPGLEVRKQIGRLSVTRRYDPSLVQAVVAAPFPTAEDDPPRDDFCLRIDYDGRRLRIGEGMGEREAEFVASVVSPRLRAGASVPSAALEGRSPARWLEHAARGAWVVMVVDLLLSFAAAALLQPAPTWLWDAGIIVFGITFAAFAVLVTLGMLLEEVR